MITSSKIDLLNSDYAFEETKFFVRKQIEIAYSDFRTAKKQYQFCMKSVVSNKQTFTISKNKYDLGIIDTFSFLETKNRLNKACLLYTSPSPRDISGPRMPSSA